MKSRFIKVLSVLMILSVLFSFVSCGKSSIINPKKKNPVPKENLKIGMIYNYPLSNNSVFDTYHHEGVEAAAKALGINKDTQIISKNIRNFEDKTPEDIIREAVTEGCNVIFALSQEDQDACEKLAGEFPDVKFLCYASIKHNDTNFGSFFAKMYEAEFLAGIAAGTKSTANSALFIAPDYKTDSEVTLSANAFARGIIVSNPNVKPYVYVNNIDKYWLDLGSESSHVEYAIAKSKCDVMAQFAGTEISTGAAGNKEVFCVGFGKDMTSASENYCMFSLVWNWSVYYQKVLGDIINGDFTTASYLGGIKEGVVGISKLNEKACGEAVVKAVNSFLEKFKSDEGYDVFQVDVKDTYAEVMLPAGEDYTYEQLVSEINYYIFGIDLLLPE
ncbi:MAG: BMP family ABC transporter substrate-binding protein [Clostridiales bacterium]|nr:BMP family ABC transporter substrate-binding protein [Clostridiales bacterium]